MFTPDLESVDTLATHAHADLDALGALAGARLLCPRARAIAAPQALTSRRTLPGWRASDQRARRVTCSPWASRSTAMTS